MLCSDDDKTKTALSLLDKLGGKDKDFLVVFFGKNVTEEEKAEYRGKNHLSIVIDRDFLCGSADICAGYSELTYARACARANQTQKALKAHYGEV